MTGFEWYVLVTYIPSMYEVHFQVLTICNNNTHNLSVLSANMSQLAMLVSRTLQLSIIFIVPWLLGKLKMIIPKEPSLSLLKINVLVF